MNMIVLSFDQIAFLLKKLNPDADIRKIDQKYNNGENILFSKTPGEKLIVPFGYQYTKNEGITNKFDESDEFYTTCKIYSHEEAKKMGKVLETESESNKKPKITKLYIYKNKNKNMSLCACYGNLGYRIASKLEYASLLIEFGKQKGKKTLNDILGDKDVITNISYNSIDNLISNIIPSNECSYYKINCTYASIRKGKVKLLENGYSTVKVKTLMGKRKIVNTDSSLTASHPNDKNIKLLAVADSDISKHIIPSSTALNILNEWFINLRFDILSNPNQVVNELQKIIYIINHTLYNTGYRNNDSKLLTTTLTTAIVLNDETIIAKIGNSSAYKIKDKSLTSLIKNKNCDEYILGSYDTYNLDIIRVENDSYDKLLLLTDGITYSLDDERIEAISNRAKKTELANALVDMAIGDYNKETDYGNDNATAVVYIKNIKR